MPERSLPTVEEITAAAQILHDQNPIKCPEPAKFAGYQRAANIRRDIAAAENLARLLPGPFSLQRCLDYWNTSHCDQVRDLLKPFEAGLGEQALSNPCLPWY